MDNLPGSRSILKSLASTTPSPRRPDARQVAIEHARILQQRKDMEASILDDLILLSEYPQHTTDPANPDPRDVADFKAHVRLFQPSDYDDLIEERNVNGLCGYTLCGRPRRKSGPGGEWTISASNQIVRRRDIEMWCSQRCARRALYVKVQLNETAAWERAGIPDIEIDLFESSNDPNESEVDRTARRVGEMQLNDQRQAAKDSAALALERGDSQSAKPTFKVALREKKNIRPPTETAADEFDQDSHLMVDNYKPKTGDRSRTFTEQVP
ncbi:hypothetical protein GMORB2_6517 [Geosmithia morbida]|uniref:RNA polymerase II subunit B1 CTD phosphatase RPAP2 homolog n=1 Tax=Geosmithia morbida TaxID=1094350 RepID=A0A9P4YXS7_9HYPO|nr:uncharacterized protein GMORB2_6517 [Geosmithia morbida]KAF4122969.1 hypothetical protein GMORB2_6517 [Geosmithia morbida]